MGIARGAHGAQWGDFFHRGGAMTPGVTERLMAAYLTWRGIPPPRSLESLIQRTLQPHVPPLQPGTYVQCSGGQDDGQRYPARRVILLPPEKHRNHHHPPAPIPRHDSD